MHYYNICRLKYVKYYGRGVNTVNCVATVVCIFSEWAINLEAECEGMLAEKCIVKYTPR